MGDSGRTSFPLDIKAELMGLTSTYGGMNHLGGQLPSELPIDDFAPTDTDPVVLTSTQREERTRGRSPPKGVAVYNALDREQWALEGADMEVTRTFPFCKPDTITTEEMKAVKKTPLGVIPSRETLKIPELNVLIEGKPTTVTPEQKTRDRKVAPKRKAEKDHSSLSGPSAPRVVRVNLRGAESMTPKNVPATIPSSANMPLHETKPAILASSGTTAHLLLAERPKPPQSRPLSQISLKSRASVKSKGGTKGTAIANANKSTEGGGALKKLSENEISDRHLSPHTRARGAEEVGAQEHQLTEGELEGVTGVSHEGTHPGAPEGEGDGEEPVVWRGERTVDEIIADLRQIQQQQINIGGAVITDTDRKIGDVIERMRFRGREMGMDFVIEQEQDPDDHVTGLQPPPSQMDVSGSSEGGNLAPHETQDEGEDELANQEPAPDADEDDDKENNFYKDIENYPGSQHRSRSGVAFDDSTTCDIPLPSASDALSEHEKLLLGRPSDVESGPGGSETRAGSMRAPLRTSSAYPSLSAEAATLQALQDVQLNPIVEASDVVNVTGHRHNLFPKKEVKGGRSREQRERQERGAKQQPYVYSNAVSFLSTWMPTSHPPLASEEEKEQQTPRDPKVGAGVSTDVGSCATRKSIHHFCCSDPAIELPFPLQSLSMALHVPSKFQGIHSVLTVDTGKEKTGANSTDHPNSPKDEEENNSCPTHRFPASDPPPDNRDAHLDPAYACATSRVFKSYMEGAPPSLLGASEEEDEAVTAPAAVTLDQWQKSAEAVIRCETPLKVHVHSVSLSDPTTRQFWTPAPPKMNVPPGYIQQTLFNNFHSSLDVPPLLGGLAGLQSRGKMTSLLGIHESTDSDDEHDSDALLAKIDVSRRTVSETDLYMNERREREDRLEKAEQDDLSRKSDWIDELVVKAEEHRVASKEAILAGKPPPMRQVPEMPRIGAFCEWRGSEGWGELFWEAQRARHRRYSHPDLSLQREHQGYSIPTDINSYLDEASKQRELAVQQVIDQQTAAANKHATDDVMAASAGMQEEALSEDGERGVSQMTGGGVSPIGGRDEREMTGEKIPVQLPQGNKKEGQKSHPAPPSTSRSKKSKTVASTRSALSEDSFTVTSISTYSTRRSDVRERKQTKAELSRLAALQYGGGGGGTEEGKRREGQPPGGTRGRKVQPLRLNRVNKLLCKPIRPLDRSRSAEPIKVPIRLKMLKVPLKVKRERKKSLPMDLDPLFQQYMVDSGYYQNKDPELEDPYDFFLNVWYKWFDEKYPPMLHDVNRDQQDILSRAASEATQAHAAKIDKAKLVVDLHSLEQPVMTSSEGEGAQLMQEKLREKLEELTERIEKKAKTSVYDLVERAAIYRKLGRLQEAWDDVNVALSREASLVEGYWHRHLLFLVQGNTQAALRDLATILKINKQHSGAFRSRGDIYKAEGDLSMAVVNYTQAIKLDPSDHMAFYNRAETYSLRKEMLLANEDYATASRLCPSLTDAKFKHGLYYFNSENYQAAVFDLNEIIRQEPCHAQARLYRGRCFFHMGVWSKALEDLSAAIHLSPQDSSPFYYRACLLRKCYPRMALQDFSVSLLLDDSYDNRMAFLHRGILYMSMGRHEDALLDFASVVQLDKNLASAHCNMGVIHLTCTHLFDKAVKYFTEAIKCQPNYIRAYICRADAYDQMKQYKLAVADFTRAMHMDPCNHHLWVQRGHILLKMRRSEESALAVKQASHIANMSSLPLHQQSLIYAFLNQYDKAVVALTQAARSKPIAPVLALLGKAQMNAERYKEAANSFTNALEIMVPWHHRQKMPKEAADVYFNLGLAQLELGNNQQALTAFNQAIAIKPKNPQAYHARGIARVRLKQMKTAILDLNKSLLQAPNMWQAFLSRACFYGSKGRYTKAILSCNEALRITKSNLRAFLYRGAFKYLCGDYEHALEDVKAAIDIDSNCSQAYFNQAVCYHTVKQFHPALKSYSCVLLLDDSLKQKVFINRGLLYFHMQDYKNALLDFYDAFKINPQGSKIGHTLGLCYHKQNMFDRAIQAYSEAIQGDKFFLDAYIGRGNVYMDLGTEYGSTMARRDYSKALILKPDCWHARVNLAYNLQVDGKFRQAWTQFSITIAQNPRYVAALEGRAIVNLQMGEAFAALKDLSAAIQIQNSAQLLTNRGVVHQFLRDFSLAMSSYQSAIRVDPGYSLAYFNAANLYFQNRQFQQACEYLDQAIRFDPKDEAAFLNRAICKVMLGDSEGAMGDFDKSISLNKYAAHAFFNRGNLFASMQQFQQAESDYTQALQCHPSDPLVLKRRADVRGKLGRREEAVEDYKRAIDIQIKLENLNMIPNVHKH